MKPARIMNGTVENAIAAFDEGGWGTPAAPPGKLNKIT